MVLSRFLRACRMVRLNIYFLFYSFVYFFSPCSKDQFADLWISPAVVLRSLQINVAWPLKAFIPFKRGLSKYIDISNQSTNEIYPPKSQIDNQKNSRTSISNRSSQRNSFQITLSIIVVFYFWNRPTPEQASLTWMFPDITGNCCPFSGENPVTRTDRGGSQDLRFGPRP